MEKNISFSQPRWSIKDILIGKTLPFAVITAALSSYLIKTANGFLNYLGNLHNESIMLHRYSLGPFSLLLILPAGIISALLLKAAANWRLSRLDPETAKRVYMRDSRFKWNALYSLGIGYFVLSLTVFFVSGSIIKVIESHPDRVFLNIPLGIAGLALPFVAGICSIKAVNRWMVMVTGTNALLIQEVLDGLHDNEIPAKYRNDQDLPRILNLLASAQAFHVRGAVALYWSMEKLTVLCKALGVVGGILAILATAATMGVVNIVGQEARIAKAGLMEDLDQLLEELRAQPTPQQLAAEEERKKKWYAANQAQKRADYAAQRAAESIRQAPRAWSTGNAVCRAEYAQREADRLNREKYKV